MADDSQRAPLPAPLERAALERVLARAAELQAVESDPGESTLTEQQIIDLGREVGLSAQHIRQALAEERSRLVINDDGGRGTRLFGPGRVHATRTIPGNPEQILAWLDAWMQRVESLQIKRRFPDRMLWDPRPGILSELRRVFNLGGRSYHLLRVAEVAATAIPIEPDRTLVRLEADVSNLRAQRLAGGTAAAAGGAVVSGIAVLLHVFVPVAVIPSIIGLAGGYAISRTHVPQVARAQLALEQVLDRLERGERRGAEALSSVAAAIREGARLRAP